MHNKYAIALLFTLFSVSYSSAQDVITLLSGVEIKGNVTEITPDVVKYKVWEAKNATENSMVLKSTVFMIKYQNGFKEVINQPINNPLDTEKQLQIDKQLVAEKPTIADRPIINNSPKIRKEDPPVSKPFRRFTAGIFGGVSLPLGNYKTGNADDVLDAAGAKTGFNVGLNLGYRFNPNMRFLLESQFTLHSYVITQSDVRYIYALRGNWFHVNIFPTFRFDVPIVANRVGFYAQGGAGLTISLLDGTLFDVLDLLKVAGYSTHFGYSGGVGFSFNGVNIGARYVGGNPVFEDYKPSIAQLQAVIGYQF